MIPLWLFDDQTIRLVNAALGIIALLLACARFAYRWHDLAPRLRLLALSLGSLLVVVVFSAIEQRIQSVPMGWRSYVSAVACIWTICALTITPRTDSTDRNP